MIGAIDVETYEYNESTGYYEPVLNARSFTLGCLKLDNGKRYFFTDADEMFNFIMELMDKCKKRRKRLFLYGHNTEYDWYAIAKNNLLKDYIKYVVFKPFLAIVKDNCYICDTMAFYRCSLKDVGDSIGLPKLEMPEKVEKVNDLKEYLERDVDITLKAITDLKEDLKPLGFAPRKLMTAGQVAMTSFLTYCRKNNISRGLLEYDPETHYYTVVKCSDIRFVREAFRGGINLAFETGYVDYCELYDLNGHYADALRKMTVPDLRTEQTLTDVSIRVFLELVGRKVGIARLSLKSPKQLRPYLPIRFQGYVVFPSDRIMRGTWTFLELKRAIELGYTILEVEKVMYWEKNIENPFYDYMNLIYDLEKKAESPQKKFAFKLIRNNLYGKFGQYRKNKDYKMVYRGESKKYFDEGYKLAGIMEDRYVIYKGDNYYIPTYVNPIISAYTTAWARDKLWTELMKVPPGELLYCDTDSVMVKKNLRHLFDFGHELGQFKLVTTGDAKILGEKKYRVGEYVKLSGAPKEYRSPETIDSEEDFPVKKMHSLKEGINRGNFNKVGGFREELYELKVSSKSNMPLPEYIDEVGIIYKDNNEKLEASLWELKNIGRAQSES